MLKRASILFAASLLVTLGFAKDKKPIMPAYVLTARTVAVIIDPSAGMSIDDPRANQDAQKDVETALLNWGRFDPVVSTRTADLIIVVRRGNGHLTNETIADPRQNNRIGAINPSDNGIAGAGQHGPQPNLSDDAGNGASQPTPHPQMEAGQPSDSFVVYKGGEDRPLDTSPAWRYDASGGLSPHSVPAVAVFRKAVENAEKAAAKKP
jgi:hypothetical protein